MSRTIFLLFSLFFPGAAAAQSDSQLKLEECYRLVQENDPAAARTALLQRGSELRTAQIDADRLPSISWNASAAIQTETVDLPIEFPGIDPIDLPLYRAQTTLDGQYALYDGGLAAARRQAEAAQLQADRQSVTVELEKLKDNVNEYFFGVLLLREKVAILETSRRNLEQKVETLEAGQRHGVVLESEVDKLRVEILRLSARIDQANGDARALLAVLADLTGRTLPEDVALIVPPPAKDPVPETPLQRAELQLFESRKASILANEQLITARRRPKVGAFVQAGLGYPNPLNFFDDTVSPFAVAGLNFSWAIVDWGKDDRDRQLLTVQSQLVDNQRAAFEHRLDALEGKFREDLVAMQRQIERDKEIVELESKILRQVSSQLDNGVITSTEYLDQVNAETRARLNLESHLLQLQQIKVNYLTQRGAL